MNRLLSLFRSQPREGGSSGRSRVFVYLALVVFALLLSYQLVLNHDALQSLSPWTFGSKEQPAEPPVSFPFMGSSNHTTNSTQPSNEKELVFAAMRHSNMSWVAEHVPEWISTIYRADADKSESEYTVPANKGNEAMVYLTYFIDRYDNLPEVMLLMHGGRYQWHNDNPSYGKCHIKTPLCNSQP